MPGLVCCSSQRLHVPPAVPGFSTLLGTALLFSQWHSLSKGDDFCTQPVVTVLLETCPGNSCRNIEVELKTEILYCWIYTIALVALSQPGHASCFAVWCMPAEILHWKPNCRSPLPSFTSLQALDLCFLMLGCLGCLSSNATHRKFEWEYPFYVLIGYAGSRSE